MKKIYNEEIGLNKISKARSLYYDFFARMLLYELLEESQERLVFSLELMSKMPFEESLENISRQLLYIVQTHGVATIKQEYTNIFVLPFNCKQIHLILSHYMSNNVGGGILLEIKDFLRNLPVRINEKVCKESEEHFGFLMVLMNYIITHENIISMELQKEFFSRFIVPYGTEIATLMKESSSECYSYTGMILDSFLNMEKGYLQ